MAPMPLRTADGTWIAVNYCEMKIAIPNWQGRISPVFDAAQSLIMVEVDNGRELRRSESRIECADPLARVRQATDMGANVLICGAISRPLETALAAANIRVISQTCGPVEDVLEAFLCNQLTEKAFLMPGCCGRRRRIRRRRNSNKPGGNK
jgi:predicted Fe-Mo cluster-binding NifX family protein